MNMTRRVLGGLCLAAAMGNASFAAEQYPSKPIRLVLPFAAGGQSDVVARLVAARLSTALGQPLVVENIAGAGGLIAAAAVARAAPNGYTLFLPNASTLTIAPYLQKGATVNPSTFTPITMVSQFPLVLVVNSASPYKSLADIVQAAKARPEQLSFASPGFGTTPHLAGEIFNRETGVSMTHVAFKGGAPALNEVLGGRIDLYFEAPATLSPHIAAGKLRAIAVTSTKRMPSLPDVPTVAEQGLSKLTLESWSAFVAPHNTPADVVARLRTELDKVLKRDDVISTLRERGFEAMSSTPDELARRIRDEGRAWSQLIKERSISID